VLQIIQGHCVDKLKELPDGSVQCCVTSPPYWGLRDYGVEGQLGLERTPEEYVARMVEVFREVRRVLREDGTLWLNIGDSYCGGNTGNQSNVGQRYGYGKESNGHVFPRDGAFAASIGLKPKDLVGIPWRLAFALQADGWWLRQDIIWHKPNPMPESVTDRCTKAHEYIFLLTKSATYYFDNEAIKQPITDSSINRLCQDVENQEGSDRVPGKTNGKMKAVRFGGNKLCPDTRLQSGNEWNPPVKGTLANKRSVWTIPSSPYSEAHFATFPPDLIKPCILAGTSARGCCPHCGAPWERVVEKEMPPLRKVNGTGPHGEHGLLGGHRFDEPIKTTTTGWRPTCSHPEILAEGIGLPPVPCTVLDPFGGSGTTGMVALELGRKAILIELNPDYVKLAESRCFVTPGLPM
jgi:DNA modification methylase